VLFPLVALALIWTLDLGTKFSADRRIDGTLLLGLALLCVLTSLVKVAFLPIFAAIIVYLAVKALRTPGGWRGPRIGRARGLALGGAVVLSLVLFGQRYGINVARYHTPEPACDKVLSVEHCNAYGPWARNYQYEAAKTSTPHNPVPFMWSWLYGMWLRSFFAVAGPDAGYQTRGPLVMPGISAIVLTGAGIVLAAAYGRRVFRRYDSEVLALATLAAALYIAVLWLDQFMIYMRVDHVVAINGRYLFPVLLPLILLGGLSAGEFLRRRKDARRLKLAMAATAVLCMCWGGGALTYVLRSNDAWYWDNAAARNVNHAIQDHVGPLVPGYRNPVQYLH
jgi:hypothetical protein